MAANKEEKKKIELQAIYRKNGSITVCDQDGREFESVPDTMASAYDRNSIVCTGIELEAPEWPADIPHATVSFRIPLKVEERLPDWMQEYLDSRL